MTTTRPKGSSFSFADQGVFLSALDVGCRTTSTAEVNTVLIIAALTAMTSGGVLMIPHGVAHNFTSADFPVTAEALCVWELTGTSFKLISNQALTSELGETLESIRIVTPKVVGIDFVDVLTVPPAYTYSMEVYDNLGTPVIAGSSFDLCYFLPGGVTPTEAIARSGAAPGRHYFFNGIHVTDLIVTGTLTVPSLSELTVTGDALVDSITVTNELVNRGTVLGSKSIQAPATGATITATDTVERLILNHAATIAALTITLPAAPVDGTPFSVFSRSVVTALTLNAGAGETIETGHTVTALAAAGSFEMVFNSADSKWYRVR